MPTSLNKCRTRDRRHNYKHLASILGQYVTRSPANILTIQTPRPSTPGILHGRGYLSSDTPQNGPQLSKILAPYSAVIMLRERTQKAYGQKDQLPGYNPKSAEQTVIRGTAKTFIH